jgi:hypothetical protein
MFRDEIASEAHGGFAGRSPRFRLPRRCLAEDSIHHFHELSTLPPFRGIMTRIEEVLVFHRSGIRMAGAKAFLRLRTKTGT